MSTPYEIQLLESTLKMMLASIEKCEQDGNYEQRNNAVWSAFAIAQTLKYPVWLNVMDDRHPNDVENEFRTAAYIELPTGLVSWHLPTLKPLAYDGHTMEQKYERCQAYKNAK